MSDNVSFTMHGLNDYIYWQTEDKRTLKKINQLIKDIIRNGNIGIGKPEPLKDFAVFFIFNLSQLSCTMERTRKIFSAGCNNNALGRLFVLVGIVKWMRYLKQFQ